MGLMSHVSKKGEGKAHFLPDCSVDVPELAHQHISDAVPVPRIRSPP